MFPSAVLCHTVTITKHRRSGYNDLGEETFTDTDVTGVRCRITAAPTRSADGTINNARCIMPRGTDIQEDDIVRSADAGFTRDYWVNTVRAAYDAAGRVSHLNVELRESPDRRYSREVQE